MAQTDQQTLAKTKWLGIDSPIFWLAYLPMFFIPWFFKLPAPPQMAAATAGLVLFLVIYFVSFKASNARLMALAIATLSLAFALAFTGSNWPVIAIYAAAMAGDLRPARRAAIFLAVFAVLTAAFGLLLEQSPFYWVLGVFMMVMVGIANVSRAALEDKNRALASAHSEVRQMAATAERERIGRDLHDLLGRTLTLVAIKAELAAKLASRDPVSAESEMREVASAARDALAEVRAAVAGMTGATLGREVAGAKSALAAAGIACTIESDTGEIAQGAGAVLAMALREAITNVIRHSGARGCKIRLTDGPGGLELTVSDDGDGRGVHEGGGLSGVRTRLGAAGGSLSVSGSAAGTRLIARLPAGDAR